MFEKCRQYMELCYSQSLHRELLNCEIERVAQSVTGKVLDIGSKNRRYDQGFCNASSIVALDIAPSAGIGMIKANILCMPFKPDSFDAVISFEVFEYILDTRAALAEVRRVLVLGGVFIFSVPFLNPVHQDVDLVRYTHQGWNTILEPHFEFVTLTHYGGRFTVIWDFYFEQIRNSYSRMAKIFLFPMVLLIKRVALFLDGMAPNNRFAMGYFIVCRRKEK